jgi:NAD(P)-dependent dehydrogenase (short-subunit alcohol dehydrogenase family)
MSVVENKVVIITGASSGIGLATARIFSDAGALVVPASRRSAPPCNVTKDDDVRQLIERTVAEHGRIDILINNAGAGLRAPLADVNLEDARQVMELNLYGALRCIKAVLPVMQRQCSGQIVNVSSVIGVVAIPRNSIYCASKFALRALSDALRMELHETGIDVISVLPGYTDTPFFDKMIRSDGSQRLSLFRGQSPDKVARAILRACRYRKREVALTFPGVLGCWLKRFAPLLVEFSLRNSLKTPGTPARQTDRT